MRKTKTKKKKHKRDKLGLWKNNKNLTRLFVAKTIVCCLEISGILFAVRVQLLKYIQIIILL